MQSKELYFDFKRKINKELGKSISYPEVHFLLNEALQIYFENIVKLSASNTKALNELRPLIYTEKELTKIDNTDIQDKFEYPGDFYKRLNQKAVVSKEYCKKSRTIVVYPKQFDDWNEALYKNPHWKPSWMWEETISKEDTDGLIVAHNNDFILDKVIIDYIRKPSEISFPECTEKGEYTIKGVTYTQNTDSELSDVYQFRKITDIAVLLYKRDTITNFQQELSFILSQQNLYYNK